MVNADPSSSYQALRPLEAEGRVGRGVEIFGRILKFFLTAYKNHWIASPSALLAALVSTFGAATIMSLLAPVLSIIFTSHLFFANAVIGPMLAYIIYLSVYYGCMFASEKKNLLNESKLAIDKDKFYSWLRVVKYDYLAHVPSDIYLISLAAIMQFGMQVQGMHIFFAVIASQLVDDFITFIKEPAIWSGAKEIVAWEERKKSTLRQQIEKTELVKTKVDGPTFSRTDREEPKTEKETFGYH